MLLPLLNPLVEARLLALFVTQLLRVSLQQRKCRKMLEWVCAQFVEADRLVRLARMGYSGFYQIVEVFAVQRRSFGQNTYKGTGNLSKKNRKQTNVRNQVCSDRR